MQGGNEEVVKHIEKVEFQRQYALQGAWMRSDGECIGFAVTWCFVSADREFLEAP